MVVRLLNIVIFCVIGIHFQIYEILKMQYIYICLPNVSILSALMRQKWSKWLYAELKFTAISVLCYTNVTTFLLESVD